MNAIAFGVLAGLVFGVIAVLLMIPLQFSDKKTAMTAAFFSRFGIGFIIPICSLPLPPYATGATIGLLISLPDAVITKAYAPIIATGIVGGLIIGWLSGQFAT
jgi:hypothetical protein